SNDPGQDVRIGRRIAPNAEEGRMGIVRGKGVQHPGSHFRDRPVIEGQVYRALLGGHPPCKALEQRSHNGGCTNQVHGDGRQKDILVFRRPSLRMSSTLAWYRSSATAKRSRRASLCGPPMRVLTVARRPITAWARAMSFAIPTANLF